MPKRRGGMGLIMHLLRLGTVEQFDPKNHANLQIVIERNYDLLETVSSLSDIIKWGSETFRHFLPILLILLYTQGGIRFSCISLSPTIRLSPLNVRSCRP